MSILITSLFFSLFITISLVPLFSALAIRFHALDIPDSRKIHKYPVPRVGGMAMAAGVFLSAAIFMPKNIFLEAFLLSAGIIIIFGLIDDLAGLDYRIKFAGQVVAALIVIFYGKVRIVTLGNILPCSLCLTDGGSVVLTLLMIVGVTNAINLADGLDGLAAGICLMAFAAIAYLAHVSGMPTILYLASAMAGAIFGFLRFNTHPATIFMGDGGSQLLGFSGIVLAISLTQQSFSLNPVLPLFLFGIPIIDTVTVIFQRLAEGKSLFMPDKNHIHHKLIKLGMYHSEAVFTIYMVQSIFVIFAVFCRSLSDTLLIAIYLLIFNVLLVAFAIAEKCNFRFGRHSIIDNGLKEWLRKLKEKGLLIRVCFSSMKASMLVIFLLMVFLPAKIPLSLAFYAVISASLLVVSLFYKKIQPRIIVRLIVYLFGPFVLYLGEIDTVAWFDEQLSFLYDISFLITAFWAIMTLRFTRRQKGFMFTPLDFLILLFVLVLSMIPDKQIQNSQLGLLASKIIILFFTFEILVGELRGNWKWPTLAVLLICALVALRGWGYL